MQRPTYRNIDAELLSRDEVLPVDLLWEGEDSLSCSVLSSSSLSCSSSNSSNNELKDDSDAQQPLATALSFSSKGFDPLNSPKEFEPVPLVSEPPNFRLLG